MGAFAEVGTTFQTWVFFQPFVQSRDPRAPMVPLNQESYPPLMLFIAGVHRSRTQRLWEPLSGPDREHIWVYRHAGPPNRHQLPAGSTVQVQLQLPTGIPGQQHAAGLVSLTHLISLSCRAASQEDNVVVLALKMLDWKNWKSNLMQ